MAKFNLNQLVLWLVSLGSLNWLLVELADFDIVMKLTDAINVPELATFLYLIIGVAGAWLGFLVLMKKVSIRR